MTVDFQTAVQSLAKGEGSLEEVVKVLDAGVDLSKWEGDGSALRCGIQANNAQLVALLLSRKADVNQQDAKGVSPLHMAVFDGKSGIVRLLLDAEADPNIKDRHDQTPLFFAPSRQICEHLIWRRADVDVTNCKKQSPLHLAAHAGLNDAVSWFVDSMKTKVNDIKDQHGHTPLFYAAHSKVKSTLTLLQLRSARADADAEDTDVAVPSPKPSPAAEEPKEEPGVTHETEAEATERADSANPIQDPKADKHKLEDAESGVDGHAEEEDPAVAPAMDVKKVAEEVIAAREAAPAASSMPEEVARQDSVASSQGSATQDAVVPRCPEQHELVAFETPEDGFMCSLCDREFLAGTTLWGCRPCDYDLCKSCLPPRSAGYVPSYYSSDSRALAQSNSEVSDGEDQAYESISDTDSFASERMFAIEAQLEEYDGCLHWQVLLKKETVHDKFGFVQANGRHEFESRIGFVARDESENGAGTGEGDMPRLPGPEVLVVRRVHESGLLQRWNERVPDLAVLCQDRIIAVNEDSTVEGMMREIREPRIFMHIMRFPDTFVVQLSKEGGKKLGFRFERPHNIRSEDVRITEITDNGCMMDYNTQQVELGRYAFVVLPEMRIEAVNDVKGDSELISEELKNAAVVNLHIRRVEPVLVSSSQVREKLEALQK
eukprot:TRINITY_DN113694_c0_g1_i1.p1 TRINITY_DN113694_c0_g1~~TRINITY_DN113694_c0_g1_i1.p1  ORF type:complete len:660 (-),score=159.18 TRINITY_DN113694_c0_g1_i1:169-2148(-)